ncbi:unnamed protein product [Gongylonema pulchrum]|uniref:FERM domain-containing protein n=1 Tax=Gongylonema pulchrum TaxID=637853 RepID=A0A183EQM4_9BILA|nr:unnamed protein product [Gongylonema pulchrum]
MMLLSTSFLKAKQHQQSALSISALNRHKNITFPLKLRLRRAAPTEQLFENDTVVIELWAEERSIADTITAFKEKHPDKEFRLYGLQRMDGDLFRLFLTILDQHGAPINKENSLKLLEHFFRNGPELLNLQLKQLTADTCAFAQEHFVTVKTTSCALMLAVLGHAEKVAIVKTAESVKQNPESVCVRTVTAEDFAKLLVADVHKYIFVYYTVCKFCVLFYSFLGSNSC